MVADHPWRGVGLGNHKVLFPVYHKVDSLDAPLGEDLAVDVAHNDYLQVLAELGLIGLVLGGLGLAVALRGLVALVARGGSAPTRAMALSLAGSLLALLVSAGFGFPLERALPPALLALVLGLQATLATPRGEADPPRVIPPVARWFGAGLAVLVLATLLANAVARIGADQALLAAKRAEGRGDWRLARAEAGRAVAFDPDRKLSWFVVGTAALRAGDPRGAASAFAEVAAAYPYHANAIGNLGFARLEAGDLDGALTQFERVLKLRPGDPRALHGRGRVREARGRIPEALADLREAAEREPGEPWYHYWRGVAAERLALWLEAHAAYSKAAALRPGWRDAEMSRERAARRLGEATRAR
jgi:Flp pilus assembly protein TadD